MTTKRNRPTTTITTEYHLTLRKKRGESLNSCRVSGSIGDFFVRENPTKERKMPVCLTSKETKFHNKLDEFGFGLESQLCHGPGTIG